MSGAAASMGTDTTTPRIEVRFQRPAVAPKTSIMQDWDTATTLVASVVERMIPATRLESDPTLRDMIEKLRATKSRLPGQSFVFACGDFAVQVVEYPLPPLRNATPAQRL